MKATLSYCGQEVYMHDRDHFYQSLLIPAPQREAFFCLYALNLELARIADAVSEEMIGHIRYAWWQEAVEEMISGGNTKGHPVLEGLAQAQLPKELLVRLVASYREHYPAHLSHSDHLIDPVALSLVTSLCPELMVHWQKTQAMIDRHHSRYGDMRRGWLIFKLLIYNVI